MEPTQGRKIIHVDMDAFFAAVEQLDDPTLRGRPVVVGGNPQSRGVVSTCSYEARRFGIHSAMSAARAYRLCPSAVFLRPRMSRYQEISRKIRDIFFEVTGLVEPLSLDEAYLDVTENQVGELLARNVAVLVKERIRGETGLTASAGVAPNKFVAKIASDFRKPDGLVVVPPEKVEVFISDLPVEKLWGVGPVRAKQLHDFGLWMIVDLRSRSVEELRDRFGDFGVYMRELAFGRDPRPVEPYRELKSRGSETTFDRDITDLTYLRRYLQEQAGEIADSMRRHHKVGRTVTLKLRYNDFTTITRSWTLDRETDTAKDIFQAALRLMKETEAGHRPVRLIGVSLSTLRENNAIRQLWIDWPLYEGRDDEMVH